jgi:Bacterial Ig-like domain (group 2)
VQTGQTVQLTATTRDAGGAVLTGRVITWATSNAGVATVSGAGLVAGVSAGTATITATSEGRTGQAVVTVTVPPPPAPVATVTVSPATASVVVGQTVQLSVVTRDASGNVLTGRVVTWVSASGSIASVLSSGLVTGVAPGTAVVTATSEGVSGQATVTVTAAPPPGTWPNEPAGFRVLTDQPWNALASLGWQHINRSSQSRIVQDPTAPFSPASVLEDTYPAGLAGGNDPADDWFSFNGTQEVYVGFWFKHSPNFESHPVGNKIAFIWSWGTPQVDFIIGVNPPPDWPLVLVSEGFGVPGAQGAHVFFPNVGSGQALPGVWHRVEVYVRNSTPLGTATGVVRWWLDGQQVGSYTNVIMPVGTAWNSFDQAPTWGGMGSVKMTSDYVRYDDAHVSRP